MIDKNDVRLGYRFLLGRDPESEDVVNDLCQSTNSISEVRETLMKSAECMHLMGMWLEKPVNVRYKHPQNLPYIPVEVEVDEGKLNSLFDRIKSQWLKLGKEDPYWSVITQPKYSKDQISQTMADFYNSGKTFHQIFISTLKRNDINPENLKSCLEVGCGVGRLTQYLCASFEKVVASDISTFHIDLAKEHLRSQGFDNLEFLAFNSLDDFMRLPKVDLVQSVITIQHNPPPVMNWMLKMILRCLNQNGVAFLQIPTYRSGYFFECDRDLNNSPTFRLEMHFLPQRFVFKTIAQEGCVCLEVREDNMVGEESSMLSNTFLIQKL